MRISIFIFLLFIASLFSTAQVTTISLNNGWQFSCDSTVGFFPATVPGNSHVDLMNNNIVPDVFYADNESKYQWIGDLDYTYRLKFEVDKTTLANDHIELVFNGLDTYASVFLNGNLILKVDNMFRRWVVDVKNIVRNENILEIVFQPVVATAKPKLDSLRYKLPADSDKGEFKTSIFTRKAAYHYGWDFAPRFLCSGIWKPVELQAWSKARIEDVYVSTDSIVNGEAFLSAHFVVDCAESGNYSIKLSDIWEIVEINDIHHLLLAGKNEFNINFSMLVTDEMLWCPAGYGNQHLINMIATLSQRDKQLDQKSVSFGIRTIELVQEPDSIGESFYFRVNGETIFAKGANVVPPDMFMGRVDSSIYERLVAHAVNANMNMLRVWGGGVYGDDYFYDLCDRNGILVWQDFMFAGAFYPLDSAMGNNIGAEARDNITRLRHHASLALWCGNNEIDEAWHNWGYQKAYGWSANDSAEIWHQYEFLFKELLPAQVARYNPETDYISTTPQFGWGREQSMTHADSHYWGVWWGNQPFSVYKQKTGRFMSEYGFQALPSMQTIRQFAGNADSLTDLRLKAHQKHPTGYQTILTYMEREFDVPDNLEDFVYLSQIVQARGLSVALLEHQRQPQCSGTLFWQLNDCWPAVSWSAIDYYGRPKALYHEAKQLFAPLYVFAEEVGDSIVIGMKSETESFTGILNVDLLAVDGKNYFSKIIDVSAPKGFSTIAAFSMSDLKKYPNQQDLVLVFSLSEEKIVASKNIFTIMPIGSASWRTVERMRLLYQLLGTAN